MNHIRWMIRRDVPEVLDIENMCFKLPWHEDDFQRHLKRRNCIGLVVEDEASEAVIAYVVYELFPRRIDIMNLAVHVDHWRTGVGTSIIDKLKGKPVSTINAHTSEENLTAQLFFAKNQFRCTAIEHCGYCNDEHKYLFEYAKPVSGEAIWEAALSGDKS